MIERPYSAYVGPILSTSVTDIHDIAGDNCTS